MTNDYRIRTVPIRRWYQTCSNKQWRWTRDSKSGTVIIIQ